MTASFADVIGLVPGEPPPTAATATWRYDDKAHRAWGVVAGLTVGQDISDGHLQFAAVGQLSLGKSGRGYAPEERGS